MLLLPGWDERLERVKEIAEPARATPVIPRCPEYYTARTSFVSTAEEAEAMADLARQRPITQVGIDFEFRYDRPGVALDALSTWHDPRSVRPLLLSLAMVEPGGTDGGRIYPFVVDLRRAEVLPSVRSILGLPCPFVGHFLQAELFCLWQLGLAVPGMLWDTWVAEKARFLGIYHKKYGLGRGAGEADEARASGEADEQEKLRLGLVATCDRHGEVHPFSGDKERLQRSFLEHPDGDSFTREQVEYSASDAVAAAQLYLPQVLAVARCGLLDHLVAVEMPWVTTNARMGWVGVRVDGAKRAKIAAASEHHLSELLPRFEAEGLTNVKSHPQLKAYFAQKGLLELFRRGGGYSFDRDQLEELKHRDPAISTIRAARRALDLRGNRLITGEFEGIDGRVHAEFRQLGTHTGRQSSRDPNLLGLGKVLRPLVIAEPGFGIGEVDLSQIEVGIAAAVYGDDRLVAMFNTGDVYSAMAQEFYAADLPEEDRRLDSREFKAGHRELRDRMKIFTLSLIYGVTPNGLARQLGITATRGAEMLGRFMAMFPTLERGLVEAASNGALRGYASTSSGLRRYRPGGASHPSNWERNWMTNHPVQGTACVLFKIAGNRLDRLYRRHGARMLIALHDAYVYEAPLEALKAVGELTQRVMIEVVEECFPVLRPDAQINDEHPECWNKDGHVDSIDHWAKDPTYCL